MAWLALPVEKERVLGLSSEFVPWMEMDPAINIVIKSKQQVTILCWPLSTSLHLWACPDFIYKPAEACALI